jgi:hypothetical protein
MLALNRTVGIVLVSVLFFGLGEQLWSPFLPAYLDAKLNGSTAHSMGGVGLTALLAVGIYACLRNLFEAACYVGGGQLTARLGDRGSLILFGALTVGGYMLFLASSTPAVAVIAALLIVGWEPLSVPVTFTTVATTVTTSNQGMAFALQSIQKRLPRIIGPAVAGFVLATAARHHGSADVGYVVGMRWLVGASLLLGLGSLLMQVLWMPRYPAPPRGPDSVTVVRAFHPRLRRLLLAEIFTRWCDWLVREFVVLYLLVIRGIDPVAVGLLFALQNTVALLTYLPIGRMTAVVGLQPKWADPRVRRLGPPRNRRARTEGADRFPAASTGPRTGCRALLGHPRDCYLLGVGDRCARLVLARAACLALPGLRVRLCGCRGVLSVHARAG